MSEQHHHGLLHLIRKLQNNAVHNIPALVAQKALSSFTLQEEPVPPQATLTVNLLVYPQNPLLSQPEIRTLPSDDAQTGLINSRVKIQDSRGITAQPDANGHYLYWADKPEFDLVNAFYYVTFTLRMFERYARRAIPWSFPSPRLIVDPHIGKMANAFYNEQERLLGFHTYIASDGKEVSTAQSSDIVSHETAHAVLDGMRDLWNESFGLGCRAIHESFGDMAAVLVALHDDSLIQRVLAWTKNDLHVTNFISEVAENLTQAIQNGENDPLENTLYLRNAINQFRATPFDDLQYLVTQPETTLSRQEHNYSRVFTGAFYDVLVGIYDQYKQNDAPFVALHRARTTTGKLLMMAIEVSPVGELDYGDLARAFLTADDMLFQGSYRTILRDVFAQRAILAYTESDSHLRSLLALPVVTLPDSLNNSLSAAMFLENTLLPALEWQATHEILPLNTFRNADGYVFMTFFSTQEMRLDGATFGEFDGATIDVFGGLTFAFNPQNTLVSATQRLVTDEDMRQIRLCVTDMIDNKRISKHVHSVDEVPKPSPKALFIRDTPDAPKLIKYPTIFDGIPSAIPSFQDYLQAWRKQGIRNSDE
jgi:hypothetical protein